MLTSTLVFYAVVTLGASSMSVFFTHRVWRSAREIGWFWLRPDSRNMYVEAAKTVIASAGVAVSLLASSGIASAAWSGRRPSELMLHSVQVAGVALIVCVWSSICTIMAMARGYDEGWSRESDRRIAAGANPIEYAKLSMSALRVILVFAGLSIFSFVVGFSFLGRIICHF